MASQPTWLLVHMDPMTLRIIFPGLERTAVGQEQGKDSQHLPVMGFSSFQICVSVRCLLFFVRSYYRLGVLQKERGWEGVFLAEKLP